MSNPVGTCVRLLIATVCALAMARPQNEPLRVTVNLVQVDAVVTDAKGNPVSDLQPADFRVLVDGKPQQLKYCSYVKTGLLPAAIKPSPVELNPNSVKAAQPAMPASPLKREQVRRTVVLFIGDLLTSAESMPAIRAGLKKFVLEQMQPGDLVAIVRSSAGLGALQDFTPDKRRLLAAVDEVRWTPNAVGIGGASAYEQIGQPTLGGLRGGDLPQADRIDSVERATLATAASLTSLLRGMVDMPGRKSVILLSDAFRLSSPEELNPFTSQRENGTGAFIGPIYASMQRIVDASVRAGVVIYAIDTRGLTSLRALASDRVADGSDAAPPTPDNPAANQAKAGAGLQNTAAGGTDLVWNATQGRRDDYKDNQWGSMFLASQTGGFMITESNRIDAGLARVLADQQGYYLLGFQPAPETLELSGRGQPVYHKLKIEVLRPGVRVRSHTGFFGTADAELQGGAGVAQLQLAKSLESPIQAQGIGTDVDATYLNVRNYYLLRTTLHIDARDILFAGPSVHRTGIVHVVLRAFDAAWGNHRRRHE